VLPSQTSKHTRFRPSQSRLDASPRPGTTCKAKPRANRAQTPSSRHEAHILDDLTPPTESTRQNLSRKLHELDASVAKTGETRSSCSRHAGDCMLKRASPISKPTQKAGNRADATHSLTSCSSVSRTSSDSPLTRATFANRSNLAAVTGVARRRIPRASRIENDEQPRTCELDERHASTRTALLPSAKRGTARQADRSASPIERIRRACP
jgi:hypothetical protein